MSNFFLSAYREFGQLVIYNLPIVKNLPTLCIRWWCIYLRTKPHSETGFTEPGRVTFFLILHAFLLGNVSLLSLISLSGFLLWLLEHPLDNVVLQVRSVILFTFWISSNDNLVPATMYVLGALMKTVGVVMFFFTSMNFRGVCYIKAHSWWSVHWSLNHKFDAVQSGAGGQDKLLADSVLVCSSTLGSCALMSLYSSVHPTNSF